MMRRWAEQEDAITGLGAMWTQCSIGDGGAIGWCNGKDRCDGGIDDGDAMMHLLTEGLNGGEDAGGWMEGVGLEHVGEWFKPGVVVVVW